MSTDARRGWTLALMLASSLGCVSQARVEPAPQGEASAGAAPATVREVAAPAGDEAPAEMRDVVATHNRWRAAHCAAPLAWSRELAAVAQRHADTLRESGCNLRHSGGPYGENLFGTSPVGSASADGVVEAWYREVASYNARRPGFSMATGHFTQVVWKGTARLGCAVARCQDAEVWVCNYDPPGNVSGEFPQNVAATGCR